MSTHYVAQLKIERVDKTSPSERSPHRSSTDSEPKREVSEVTLLTIKGDTLDGLVARLSKHLAIIEED